MLQKPMKPYQLTQAELDALKAKSREDGPKMKAKLQALKITLPLHLPLFINKGPIEPPEPQQDQNKAKDSAWPSKAFK